MLVAIRVDEQDRARPQRRRKDQPAVGAKDDKMIAAYGLHERRIGYETGKAEKVRGRLPVRNQQPFRIQNFGLYVDAGLKRKLSAIGRPGT